MILFSSQSGCQQREVWSCATFNACVFTRVSWNVMGGEVIIGLRLPYERAFVMFFPVRKIVSDLFALIREIQVARNRSSTKRIRFQWINNNSFPQWDYLPPNAHFYVSSYEYSYSFIFVHNRNHKTISGLVQVLFCYSLAYIYNNAMYNVWKYWQHT